MFVRKNTQEKVPYEENIQKNNNTSKSNIFKSGNKIFRHEFQHRNFETIQNQTLVNLNKGIISNLLDHSLRASKALEKRSEERKENHENKLVTLHNKSFGNCFDNGEFPKANNRFPIEEIKANGSVRPLKFEYVNRNNDKDYSEKKKLEQNLKQINENFSKIGKDFPLKSIKDFLCKENKEVMIKELDNPHAFSDDFLKYLEKNIEILMKEFLEKTDKKYENFNDSPHKFLNKKRLIFKINKINKTEKKENSTKFKGRNESPLDKLLKTSSFIKNSSFNTIMNQNLSNDKSLSSSNQKNIVIDLNSSKDEEEEHLELDSSQNHNHVIDKQSSIERKLLNKSLNYSQNKQNLNPFNIVRSLNNRCGIRSVPSINNQFLETIFTSFSGKIPRNYIGKILKIWDFALNVLKMDYFSEQDLYDILLNTNDSFSLISLMHRKLIKLILDILINEIEYEDLNNNYMLMLKVICEENDPEEIIKLCWFEILRFLVNSPLFNLLYHNQKDTYSPLKKVSSSSYNKLTIDMKILLLHFLIDSCLSSNGIKNSLEDERNDIMSKKDLYYIYRINYQNNKLKQNVLKEIDDNCGEIISEIKKSQEENHMLKTMIKEIETDIYLFSIKNNQYLGRDRYGNKFHFFIFASDKLYIRSFKAGRGWFYLSTNEQFMRLIQSLSISNVFERMLIQNLLLIFPKLTAFDGIINEDQLSKLNKSFHINNSDDVQIYIKENQEFSEYFKSTDTIPLICLKEKTSESICDIVSSYRNKSKYRKNDPTHLKNCYINVSNSLKNMEMKFSECLRSNGREWESLKNRQEIHEKLEFFKESRNFNSLKEVLILFNEKMKFCYEIDKNSNEITDSLTVKLWKKEFLDKGLYEFLTDFIGNEVNSIESLYLSVKFFELIVLTYVKNNTKIVTAEERMSQINLEEDESSFSEEEEKRAVKKKNNLDLEDEDYTIEKEENEDMEECIYKTNIKNKLQKKFRNRLRKISKIDKLGKKPQDLKFEALQNICEICGETEDLVNCNECISFFHLKCLDLTELPEKWKCEGCKSKKIFNVERREKESVPVVNIAKKNLFTIIKNH